jgi:hypothetical protein
MFFVNAEYLLWFLKRDNLPALVTQGDANQSQFLNSTGIPGALGVPGTVVLDQHLNGDTSHSGVRLNVGAWLDTEQTLGIQGSYFFLFQAGPKTSYSGDGSSSTVISRPFFNVATGVQDASEVYGPGVSGALSITNPSSMMGGDVNVVYNYSTSSLSGIRLAWLIGARYLALDEKLVINQTSDYLPDSTGVGAQTYVINDNFTTYNRFYGGQVGGQIESLLGPLYVQILAKCALGQTNETVHISGMTTQNNPPDPNLGLPGVVTSASGLLAQPSNVGKYTRNTLSLVPEAQLNIGYSFNENFMLKLGYNLIVWTNVVRPGTSISTSLNQQPLGDPVPVQPALPQFNFHSSTFWAQGFQVGFQWTF